NRGCTRAASAAASGRGLGLGARDARTGRRVELDVLQVQLPAKADDVAIGEQAPAHRLRVHEDPVRAAGIFDDRADPAHDEAGVYSADEFAPDADVVAVRPPDRDARFGDRISRPVRRLEHGDRPPVALQIVAEQLADANDLDVLGRVGRPIDLVVRGAVRRGAGNGGRRLARSVDLALQPLDHALLRIELRLELADQMLLSDELLAQ